MCQFATKHLTKPVWKEAKPPLLYSVNKNLPCSLKKAASIAVSALNLWATGTAQLKVAKDALVCSSARESRLQIPAVQLVLTDTHKNVEKHTFML